MLWKVWERDEPRVNIYVEAQSAVVCSADTIYSGWHSPATTEWTLDPETDGCFPPAALFVLCRPHLLFWVNAEVKSGCVGLLALGYINILWGSACFLSCLTFIFSFIRYPESCFIPRFFIWYIHVLLPNRVSLISSWKSSEVVLVSIFF